MKKYITNDIAVNDSYRIFLADNSGIADKLIALYAGPIDAGMSAIYLETNGNTVYLGKFSISREGIEFEDLQNDENWWDGTLCELDISGIEGIEGLLLEDGILHI